MTEILLNVAYNTKTLTQTIPWVLVNIPRECKPTELLSVSPCGGYECLLDDERMSDYNMERLTVDISA